MPLFEKLLQEARREAEPKTGRGEALRPLEIKGGQHASFGARFLPGPCGSCSCRGRGGVGVRVVEFVWSCLVAGPVLVGVREEAVRGATRSLEAWVGGESGRCTRDADWRRSSAGCVARACASVWEVLERARRPREKHEIRRGYASGRRNRTSRLADHRGGQVTCYSLAGPVRSSRSHVIKVHGPCLPLSSLGVAIPLLLSECCGAVCQVELNK